MTISVSVINCEDDEFQFSDPATAEPYWNLKLFYEKAGKEKVVFLKTPFSDGDTHVQLCISFEFY